MNAPLLTFDLDGSVPELLREPIPVKPASARSSRLRAATRDPAIEVDAPPLAVDLDGTLLRSNLLIESAFTLARTRPSSLALIPL